MNEAQKITNGQAQIVETKSAHGEKVWRIIINGRPHPVDFIREDMALAHLGLLRSRGFQEGVRAA